MNHYWTCMRIASPTISCLIISLVLMGLVLNGHAAEPRFTLEEQEVIEAILEEHIADRDFKRLVIRETAKVFLGLGTYEQYATELRDSAKNRESAFKEALNDFLEKNRDETKIIFPSNIPSRVELVSEAVLEEIFSVKRAAIPSAWDIFHHRFPGSGDLITISRVGVDSKGTVAIVYLGRRSSPVHG